MTTNQLIYRVYSKQSKQAHLLLGVVTAISADMALEKAKKGEWTAVFVDPARENDHENWVSMV